MGENFGTFNSRYDGKVTNFPYLRAGLEGPQKNILAQPHGQQTTSF